MFLGINFQKWGAVMEKALPPQVWYLVCLEGESRLASLCP